MARHRWHKRSQVPGTMTQLGLAWYGREDWKQLREIADDRDNLDDTYEDWERQALKMIHDLEAVGQRIQKVPIDIEAPAHRTFPGTRLANTDTPMSAIGTKQGDYGYPGKIACQLLRMCVD